MSNSKNLKELFSNIDNRYDISKPTSNALQLDKLNYNIETDDEIENLVKASLDDKYKKQKNTVSNNIMQDFDKLNSQKGSVIEQNEDNVNYINKLYDDRFQNASDEALTRGLARSSVIMGQLTDFNQDRIAEILQSSGDKDSKLAEIQNALYNLSATRQDKFDELDSAYQNEMMTETKKLIQERDKKMKEMIEFNNKINQIEFDNEQKNNDAKTDYNYKSDTQKKTVLVEKFNKALNYYNTLPKSQLKTAFNTDYKLLKDNIGDMADALKLTLGIM